MPRKFFATAELCAILLALTASGASATLAVRFHNSGNYYVGEEAFATISSVGGLQTHVYTVIGSLPPGCYLEQNGATTANIKGKPTSAGMYSFTVNVRAKTLDYSSGRMGYADDYGSVACVMTVSPARNNSGNQTNNNTGNNNTGNNNTGNNTNTGGISSGSSGGCNSGIASLILALTALIPLKKSGR